MVHAASQDSQPSLPSLRHQHHRCQEDAHQHPVVLEVDVVDDDEAGRADDEHEEHRGSR